MVTKATNDYLEIEWELQQLIDRDPEERMKVYAAMGKDKDGNTYSGSAYFYCDELDEVRDIEFLSNKQEDDDILSEHYTDHRDYIAAEHYKRFGI